MAKSAEAMTMADHGKYARRAMSAIFITTCFAIFAHVSDSYIERQEVRAEREIERIAQASRDLIKEAPVAKYFYYESVEPVSRVQTLGEGEIHMQSTATVNLPGPITHQDRLQCWAVDEEGNRGKGSLLASVFDVVDHENARTYGPEKTSNIPEGYIWTDGLWFFTGQLPEYEADCEMISRPCMEITGIEKCQTIRSGWIYFREPDSDTPMKI